MKKIILLSILIAAFCSGCASTETIQEYYVDNAENPEFLSLDLPVSLLNLDQASLTETQKKAVSSFKKLNILAFKKTDANTVAYQKELSKVNKILKNSDFEELMRMNTPMGKASVQVVGDDESIDEAIIYGSDPERGFALIRVLGKNIKPSYILELMQAIEKSDYNGEGLEKLEEFFGN